MRGIQFRSSLKGIKICLVIKVNEFFMILAIFFKLPKLRTSDIFMNCKDYLKRESRIYQNLLSKNVKT